MKLRAILTCLLFATAAALAVEPPVIPVGLDAYRMWDRWPYQRIGARTYMRSTYDRRGGNEGADASHFLYQLADDFNVTLDVPGPGVLYFARFNHWHGSPWHFKIDCVDKIVQETSTADPKHPVADSTFLPQSAFPTPLNWTWSQTRGADLIWTPIPFEKWFQMAYSRTHYGTGYYIYQQFVPGAKLSQPIRSWNTNDVPSADVLSMMTNAGTGFFLRNFTVIGHPFDMGQDGQIFSLNAKGNYVFSKETDKPLMLRALDFYLPRDHSIDFGRMKLRITWDGMPNASVDAPIALFFGAGTLYNRDNREYLVKSLPMAICREHLGLDDDVRLSCFFPMPFFKSARFEVINDSTNSIENLHFGIRYMPMTAFKSEVGYFHATYKDFPTPEAGKDLVLLDTSATEGGGDWSGSFVGTSFIFTHSNNLTTLEGDPRFFFDDSQTPQGQGTGTEEWGGGGDYWGGQNMTLPFAGHPVGARNLKEAKNDEDKIHSAYRFLLADLMPFGKNARIQLEHGGENQSTEHYETVTYWYGINSPSLIKTDSLQLGDSASEQSHDYKSTNVSEPYEITSRYEWGVDTLKGQEIYPAETDHGRKMTGTSEFTLKLNPTNYGVLLRRKLDYSFPNQRAEVYVADATRDTQHDSQPRWELAGTWYLAGGNTCVYSNPKDELGATQHIVETSNRRFRDDEFLLPRELTEGRSSIRVRIKYVPVPCPLFPAQPLPELAWSEIRYDAYCFVMPEVK
jgi:hypothetical protein